MGYTLSSSLFAVERIEHLKESHKTLMLERRRVFEDLEVCLCKESRLLNEADHKRDIVVYW